MSLYVMIIVIRIVNIVIQLSNARALLLRLVILFACEELDCGSLNSSTLIYMLSSERWLLIA